MPDTPPLPKTAGKEIGRSGTLISQGIIIREEYNARLTRQQLIEKIEIMRRSNSTIRGTLQVVKLPILSAEWKMQAAQNQDGDVDPNDQEIADYIQHQLFEGPINFFDFLRQLSTGLEFGYAVFEKVCALNTFNGQTRIGLSKLAFRKQRTILKWEQENGQPGVHQMIGDGQEFDIPRDKLVVFSNDKEGDNFDGISLLRYAYKDWDMLDKLTIVNAIALEKMGVGVPVAMAKEGQTPSPQDIADAEEALREFRANENGFINLPASMTVEMLDMKANTTKEIIPTLNYHDSRISKAVLAGFLELGGSSGSGAHALAKDLTALFMKSEEGLAKQMQAVIQEDIVNYLCDLNFSDLPNGYPQITFGSISDDNISEMSTALAALADKKLLTPDIDLEASLRKSFKLPAMSQDASDNYEEMQKAALELAKNPPQPVAPVAPGANMTKPALDDKGQPVKPAAGTTPPKTIAKPDVKAAVEATRIARGKLLDVLLG